MSTPISFSQNDVGRYLQEYQSFQQQYQNYSQSRSTQSGCDADAEAAGCMDNSPPVDRTLNENLHLVWLGHFHQKFAYMWNVYQHIWCLEPSDTTEVPDRRHCALTSKEIAKVRFICEECGKSWTSMQGIAMFWAILEPQGFIVRFSLYGQKCSDCNSQKYQSAIWYPEEVIKVIDNVFQKVCRIVYHQGDGQQLCRTGTRVGRPLRSHDSKNCQACAAGCCTVKSRTRRNNTNGVVVQGADVPEIAQALPEISRKHCNSTSSTGTESGYEPGSGASSRMSPVQSSSNEAKNRIEDLVPLPEALSRN